MLILIILLIVFSSVFLLGYNVGGMKSLGIAGYFPVQLHRTLCVAEYLTNHLNPNVLNRMLWAGVLCFLSFFFQFATLFLSVVRSGRQALWLVLVVRWLFRATSQSRFTGQVVLDYEALAITLSIQHLYIFLSSCPKIHYSNPLQLKDSNLSENLSKLLQPFYYRCL